MGVCSSSAATSPPSNIIPTADIRPLTPPINLVKDNTLVPVPAPVSIPIQPHQFSLEDIKNWTIDPSWISSFEGQEIFTSFFSDSYPSGVFDNFESKFNPRDCFCFEVQIFGSPCIGKSNTLLNLAGLPIPYSNLYIPTIGTQIIPVTWFISIPQEKLKLNIKIEFWERNHPSDIIENNTDGILFICAATDFDSFSYIDDMIAKNSQKLRSKPFIVVVTKNDHWQQRQVSEHDLNQLKEKGISVKKISNVKSNVRHWTKTEIQNILNELCFKLVCNKVIL